MEGYILNQIEKVNIEFRKMFFKNKAKGLIKTFDIFYEQFHNTTCHPPFKYPISKDKEVNLWKVYEYNYNLFSPYITMLYTIKSLLGTTIGEDIIDQDVEIIIGKQYLTRNFPNIYDCTCVWFETKHYIIDPILGIVVDKEIKEDMLYKDVIRNIKFNANFSSKISNFNMLYIFDLFESKVALTNKYSPPKTMIEILKKPVLLEDKSTLMRDYLADNNKSFYNKLMILKSLGEVEDLSLKMSEYDKLYFAKDYNPDLTLGKLLRKGENYGRCGMYAKAFSNLFYKDIKHTIHMGVCKGIRGSKNSFDGSHAWLEVGDKLIDTSLMMAIPLKYKEDLGYKTEISEVVGVEGTQNNYFGNKLDIVDELVYGDIMLTCRENGAVHYSYDYMEELYDFVNHTGKDMCNVVCNDNEIMEN